MLVAVFLPLLPYTALNDLSPLMRYPFIVSGNYYMMRPIEIVGRNWAKIGLVVSSNISCLPVQVLSNSGPVIQLLETKYFLFFQLFKISFFKPLDANSAHWCIFRAFRPAVFHSLLFACCFSLVTHNYLVNYTNYLDLITLINA